MENQARPESAPRTKYKSFKYHTQIEWLGGRAGTLGSEGKPAFRIASPPEFKGEAGVWCPEDLFVAAVNACIMTTFVVFFERLKLPVVSYACDAEGLLEFSEGKYRITRVTLRPRIKVQTGEAVAPVRKALHDAHDNCFVSNSILTAVEMEPDIIVLAQ